MGNWLRFQRDRLRAVKPEQADEYLSIHANGHDFKVSDLIKLAQLAVLPDEQTAIAPDGNSFTGHLGEWTTLGELPDGALFLVERCYRGETWAGRFTRVTLASRDGQQVSCVDQNGVTVQCSSSVKVRPIHLPEPPQPQPEPSLDERAWALLEQYAAPGKDERGFISLLEVRQLLAEKQAQEEADKP